MTIRGEFEEILVESPPEGWTRGYVTLTLRHPEERVPVEAWRRGAFAVHQSRLGGRLTHAPTGLCIWTFNSMDTAAEAAEALEPLADWDSFTEMLPAGTPLYPKAREIIDKIVSATEAPNSMIEVMRIYRGGYSGHLVIYGWRDSPSYSTLLFLD